MMGPPGSGKSMLAARLPGLLPPLEPSEALEVSMIHSVAGQLAEGRLLTRRPFRDPHHSASVPSLVGGGMRARPGEVSLAHNGVLFLDELPEFHGIMEQTHQGRFASAGAMTLPCSHGTSSRHNRPHGKKSRTRWAAGASPGPGSADDYRPR
ncbi:Predicted ATPase with chaperone activity [Paramagnetospirillum magneticum AMB-1]|uniref:Predicted ATPase with chaperone activity n=1 Tax=Paramagnetospirillum magneticum (strain ATCC 700264 / AMB-1) TaxID=342108 RepID=Q2VYK1_PARM1|nr:Predicted ATPase with chaperone activity [Paramagnetospirillum magneticum AMB-1]